MYEYEIPGSMVVEDGNEVGTVVDLLDVPGGQFLVVQREGEESLIPFRAPFVVRLDRDGRRIEVKLPPGLLEV
jgi:16S rRNA processing protein RimM